MKLSKLASHPNGTGPGVVKDLVTTAEYAVASFAFGYVQNAFPGRAKVGPAPLDLAVGVAAKAVSLGLTLFGKVGGARSHLDVLGNAGIGAYFHTLGSGHGFKKSGRVRAILNAGDAAKVMKVAPATTVFGVSARAPQGDLLSASDLANLAR